MKIINTMVGKIGNCIVGPKYYLNRSIRLGEAALCIARDEQNPSKPCIWIVGGIEQLIDYISLARSKGELEEDSANILLHQLDEVKKKIPCAHMERLASVLGMEVAELNEIISLAQVCVSAPIEGIRDFSNSTPKWIPKTLNYASVH